MNLDVRLCFVLEILRPPRSTRTTTLFLSSLSSDLLAGVVDEQAGSGQRSGPVVPVDGGATELRRQRIGAAARAVQHAHPGAELLQRSEEHTSELQSLKRLSYAVFCLKKKL